MTQQDVFSRKAEEWWDRRGAFKMLHTMNDCRMAAIIDTVGPLKHKSILDYGCGGGILAESLAQQGAKVTAVDISQESICIATQHARAQGLDIEYIQGTIDELQGVYFDDKPFDMVCALECLEHVEHPQRLIESLVSGLKKGGYAVFSTLNRNMYAYLMGIVAAEYLLGWVEPGTHEYEKFIKPSELVKMARRAGLELQVLQGMTFDMRTQLFTLTHDVKLNYIAFFQK